MDFSVRISFRIFSPNSREGKTHNMLILSIDDLIDMAPMLDIGPRRRGICSTATSAAGRLAAVWQMSMVPMTWPAFPDRADIDMFGCVTPAKAVGGDLYDFRIREGKLFFCIGDVSGKGIPAALVMTVVSSMFRMLSDTEENPAKIVSSINYSLSARNESLMFITLFVGALDLSTGELQYVNAGHNAPILIFGGKPRMLQVDSNLPVGIMQDWEFSMQKTTLAPGTVLFLYTDGLTEATRSGGQLFGEARVLETLAGQDEKNSAEDIITHMTDAVSDFVGDSEQSDDLTMLVMKILHSTLSPSA